MTTMETLAGTTVEVDAEGFLTDPQQWNEDVAAAIAGLLVCRMLWLRRLEPGRVVSMAPQQRHAEGERDCD